MEKIGNMNIGKVWVNVITLALVIGSVWVMGGQGIDYRNHLANTTAMQDLVP